jgi:coenzyme F420-reducing hydrogenase gamma subunit
MKEKKKLAVWKFASCDGCQLSILDCEDELLYLADNIQIAYFPEATKTVIEGPYDVSLVEGSITTPHDEQRIQEVRQQSRFLITIGACATAGGIQSLRNYADVDEYISRVYAHPEYINTLETSTPIEHHVKVDFELRGCPVNKYQLLEVLSSFLNGKHPNIPNHSVCVDCKFAGNVCVAVSKGEACLGPVTQAGCGALCPKYYRGCFGCFGPKERSNTEALTRHLTDIGLSKKEIIHLYRNFNSYSETFSEESRKIESNGQAK